jgi:nitroreductase
MSSKDKDLFQKGPQINYHEEAPAINIEEFHKLIQSRRSIRIFDEKEAIPEAVMKDCLEMALLAPNSSNLQPWEFYWIRNPEKKALLVEACFSQLAAKTAQELVIAVAHTKTWKSNNQQILHYLTNKKNETPKSVLHYYGKLIPFMMNQGPLVFWSF